MLAIPGYTFEKVIDQGAVGTVYRAMQDSLARPVAIKVLDATGSYSEDSGRRFLLEAKIIASFHHKNIVGIHDFGAIEEFTYIVMEFLPGGNLQAALSREGAFPVRNALGCSLSIARAIQYAHTRNVVHRDVKPSNILFRKDGGLVLTDFGIAKLMNSDKELTQTGNILGTPHYVSPEQVQGGAVDGRTDIYSLGVMLYEMLCGERPYDGDAPMAVLFKHVREPVPTLPDSLSKLQPLIDRSMAKDPAQRFGDVAAFVVALQSMREAFPAHANKSPRRPKKKSKHKDDHGKSQPTPNPKKAPKVVQNDLPVAHSGTASVAATPSPEPSSAGRRLFLLLFVLVLGLGAGLGLFFWQGMGDPVLAYLGIQLEAPPPVVAPVAPKAVQPPVEPSPPSAPEVSKAPVAEREIVLLAPTSPPREEEAQIDNKTAIAEPSTVTSEPENAPTSPPAITANIAPVLDEPTAVVVAESSQAPSTPESQAPAPSPTPKPESKPIPEVEEAQTPETFAASNLPPPSFVDQEAFQQHLLDSVWFAEGEPVAYLPSLITQCKKTGDGGLECLSGELAGKEGFVLYGYKLQAILSEITRAGHFQLHYRKRIIKITQAAPQDLPVRMGWQKQTTVLDCRLEQLLVLYCGEGKEGQRYAGQARP